MKTVCLFTKNSRLSQKWQNILSKNNNVIVWTEFEQLKKVEGENIVVVFHDDRAEEVIVEELDSLHDIFSKKNIFVLRSQPNLKEGEMLLSHNIGGYGNANMSDDVFLQAIEVIQSGSIWLYPDLMTYIVQKINVTNSLDKTPEALNVLSDREKEVASLVSKGETNQQIADNLEISINTVKLHIASIFEKLNIHSRIALALLFSEKTTSET